MFASVGPKKIIKHNRQAANPNLTPHLHGVMHLNKSNIAYLLHWGKLSW